MKIRCIKTWRGISATFEAGKEYQAVVPAALYECYLIDGIIVSKEYFEEPNANVPGISYLTDAQTIIGHLCQIITIQQQQLELYRLAASDGLEPNYCGRETAEEKQLSNEDRLHAIWKLLQSVDNYDNWKAP
jgi:hypothetical protein